MKSKIEKVIDNLKKLSSNYRWKIRYDNLLKKHTKDIEYYESKIEELKETYSKEKLILELEETKRTLEHRTLQRDLLRKDNRELIKKLEQIKK